MTTIDLYQVLRKIPDVSEDQAKQAASTVVEHDQVATKSDVSVLKSDISVLKADIAELETRLTWRIMSCAGLILAAIGALAIFK